MDDFDLRLELESTSAEALELADRIAEQIAASLTVTPELCRMTVNYMQLRTTMRRLRRALVVEVAG